MQVLTNWRAGCGKSACPVRREGWHNPMRHPYPYRQAAEVHIVAGICEHHLGVNEEIDIYIMFFAGDVQDDLKIEADTDFDCFSRGFLEKSIVKPSSLSHANTGLGERQTWENNSVEALYALI